MGRERGVCDAFVGDDSVVAISAAEVALVVAVPAARGHGGVVEGGVYLRFGLQLGGE